jgi:hypothetical protein
VLAGRTAAQGLYLLGRLAPELVLARPGDDEAEPTLEPHETVGTDPKLPGDLRCGHLPRGTNGCDLLPHQADVVAMHVGRDAPPVVPREDADGLAAATGADVLAGLGGDPSGNINAFEGYDDPTRQAQRWV